MPPADELTGERKNVTILFADVVDSTVLVGRMDPEDAAELLAATVRHMEESVLAYGGTVAQRLGDGIMAVFGAPVAVEDHAIRAAYAALEIEGQIWPHARAPKAVREAPVAIRVGINSGEAVVRMLGTRPEDGIDVLGFPVHLAARLQAVARPGAICISVATYSALQNEFDCTALGPRDMKGVEVPTLVYSLDRARGKKHSRPGLERHSVELPFIGRAREIATVTRRLQCLVEGEGGIIGISGEAGIGKSRLMAEARSQIDSRLIRWLEGGGVSFGRSISYLPLLQLLRTAIGSSDTDSEADMLRQLSDTVHRLFGEQDEEILPYLATFMGLPVSGALASHIAYLDGDAIGHQLRRCLWLFLQRLARRTPLVLAFEDLNWFDDSSVALIEHLLPLVETQPILIILVSRGESDAVDTRLHQFAAAAHPARFVDLPLSPLAASDSAAVVTNLLKADDAHARLREQILEKAEGNPLFIEEAVRTLIETGALLRDRHDGRWRLAIEIESIRIPNTISDVIMARVDRLEDQVKNVLLIACVIGRTFLYKVLRAIASETERLDNDVTELLRLDFIKRNHMEPELEYVFRHAIIQEVTYASIFRNRRRQLHNQVGETLESLFPDRLDELSGVLAYHFGQAEKWDKAQAYLLTAGSRADRLAADSEALHYYREAVDVCVRTFGDRIDPALRATMERKVGEAYFRRGEHAEAIHHFDQALAILAPNKVGLTRHVRRALAREIAVQAFYSTLPRLRRQRSVPANDRVADEIEIYRMMGWIVFFSDPESLLLYTLMILNVSEASDYPFGVAISAAALGFVCDAVGWPGLAERYHRQAHQAAERAGNPVAFATERVCRAWHDAYLGDWDAAVDRFVEAAATAWSAADLRSWCSAIWGRCLLCCGRGDFAIAWELAATAITTAQEAGDLRMPLWGRLCKGMTLARVGRLMEADAELSSVVELALQEGDCLLLPQAAAELALCHVHNGRLAEAFEVFDIAIRIVRQRHIRGHHVAMLRNAFASAVVADADSKTGSDRKVALRRARRACMMALDEARTYGGAVPHAKRAAGSMHWLCGREKEALQCWQDSITAALQLGARYEIALTHREMGHRAGRKDDLEAGQSLLRELIGEFLAPNDRHRQPA